MSDWSVGKQEITVVERTSAGRGKYGVPQVPSETQVTGVKATVNPVPGDVLLTLPEGERAEKNLRVLTTYELTAADDYSDEISDHVIIRDERYEVRDVQIYEKIIPHYEYRVMRVRPEYLGAHSSAFSSAYS